MQLKKFSLSVLALLFSVSALPATPLTGSLVIGTFGATIDGSDLETSTVYDPIGIPNGFTGNGSGHYGLVPLFSGLSGGRILRGDLTNFQFLLQAATILGSFVANSAEVISRDSFYASYQFLGTFTPQGDLASAGFEATLASFRVSLNRAGGSTSYVGTLASVGTPAWTPIETPEPSTLTGMLAGIVLFGALAASRNCK